MEFALVLLHVLPEVNRVQQELVVPELDVLAVNLSRHLHLLRLHVVLNKISLFVLQQAAAQVCKIGDRKSALGACVTHPTCIERGILSKTGEPGEEIRLVGLLGINAFSAGIEPTEESVR